MHSFATGQLCGILHAMTKGTAVFLLGLLILIVPSLGIPSSWKQIIFIAIGVLLVAMGYALRRAQYLRTLNYEEGVRTSETFVETTQNLFEGKG